jgi:hypothetical protein
MKRFLANSIYLCAVPLLYFTFAACAGRSLRATHSADLSLFSDDIKKEINGIANTVVSITCDIKYEIQRFNYEQVNGQFVPDPKSPLKYKLAANNGADAIVIETEEKTLSGGGLIIHTDPAHSRYTIVTSNHLVAPPDTTNIYYLDQNGQDTDVLFARYVVKDLDIWVRGESNWRSDAKLLISYDPDDLAIIESQTSNLIGREYHNPIAFDLDLTWGDWVFLFGFPKGVKQLTGGWVSPSPYPNTLAVDAVVRFGFSGGPVFALTKDARLIFVGVIKSVPRSTMDFVAPRTNLPMGYRIGSEELPDLVVRREIVVEYGTAYFVNPKTLQRFFNANRDVLETVGTRLHPKYYDSKVTPVSSN